MTVTLNEDILTLVYSYTSDFDVLQRTTTAIATKKQHPLRNIVLRRLLQLPLRLSSERLEDSRAVIQHFVRNSTHADLIRDIVIVLGPSRKSIAENLPFLTGRKICTPDPYLAAQMAEALVELLPGLLRRTKNLQHLDWFDFPSPNLETLKILSGLSFISHLSIDCAASSRPLPPQLLLFDTDSDKDNGNDIKPLFSTVGPKVRSLDLRHIDEGAFNVIEEGFPPLENVRTLKLDLACGTWDWDGGGSPQPGPSDNYRFPRISDHVQELELLITDLLARKQKGPVELIKSKKLKKLKVEVIHCYGWCCLNFVHLFLGFTAADFSCLIHLTIDDHIRDMRRWATDDENQQGDWKEGGRAYVGIHELISSLPQLRHLWVNERVLAIPSSDNKDDVWLAKAFDQESQESIMSRTIASPQWVHLKNTFEKLESLRVGFGPLNATWAAEILSHCDHTKLKAFGFDWEWQPGSNRPGEFSGLIATISKFDSLADIHILHPYSKIPDSIAYGDPSGLRLAMRQVHEGKETEDLAKGLLSGLPRLYRVGIGRNSVWERRTQSKEGGTDEFLVQRMHKAEVPSFYDAGSTFPLLDDVEHDEYPSMKDVLKLLKEL